MKNARFIDLISNCGRPEVYLHLLPFAKDAKLKRADKQRRLVTVFQTLRGNQTDHAEVGFHEGGSHQYLIFPKSAAAFADKKIVGIKYELIEPPPPRGANPRTKPPKKPPAETAVHVNLHHGHGLLLPPDLEQPADQSQLERGLDVHQIHAVLGSNDARILGTSPRTIGKHRDHISPKLEVAY